MVEGRRGRCAREEGFSLIEALVALLVLGIATAGLLRAAEAHVDTIRGLELRAAAEWVAENRLVELGLPGGSAMPDKNVDMLGNEWLVTTTFSPSADPDLSQVLVAVRTPGASTPTVTLRGFVPGGATAS